MSAPVRIAVVGAGNVGTHMLAFLGAQSGVEIVQLWSRKQKSADVALERARGFNASVDFSKVNVTTDNGEICRDADFYIISVPDRAVASVAGALAGVSGVVAHTSGSVGMDALTGSGISNAGVFYPLQTFSALQPVDYAEVPFFLEASNEKAWEMMERVCKAAGVRFYPADSGRRAVLHLAAVLASNFSNHLMDCARRVLEKDGLPLTVLEPLMYETVRKAMTAGPQNARTGPAARGDMAILDKQYRALADNPGIQEIYGLLSRSIVESCGHNKE